MKELLIATAVLVFASLGRAEVSIKDVAWGIRQPSKSPAPRKSRSPGGWMERPNTLFIFAACANFSLKLSSFIWFEMSQMLYAHY